MFDSRQSKSLDVTAAIIDTPANDATDLKTVQMMNKYV